MNPRTFVWLLLAALTAVAASCGGDDSPSASLAGSASPAASVPSDQVRITYYGHSMFTIESPGGVTVLTDPNEGIGYAAPSGEIDIIAVSHEHFDHNKIEVAPNARIIRGLTEDGDWADVDEAFGDVRIRAGRSYHDDKFGEERGKNAIFLFEIAGLRIVHAGDLGHNPSEQAFEDVAMLEALLGLALSADVLLLPTGGHFTIGPEEADQVVDTLHPTLVIPMHYRTDFLHNLPDADELATVDGFTAGKVEVQRPRQSTVTLEAGAIPTGVLVLEPQPE
jgi:L-ascorbate metabolism protein UlaG (beta-lactamase superfamily)